MLRHSTDESTARFRVHCMRFRSSLLTCYIAGLLVFQMPFLRAMAATAESSTPEIGVAVRDITPELPIWLAGYAGRKRPADKVDHPLLVQALALKNSTGERFVFVALDNCEVSHPFMQPVLQQFAEKYQLGPGGVAVVSSHTHSTPVLEQTLTDMVQPTPEERERIARYSQSLRSKLVEAVGAALSDCQPAVLAQGLGRATFAVNRRLLEGDRVRLSDSPDGTVAGAGPLPRVRR